MALVNGCSNGEVSTKKLLDAQAHVWNHIFAFTNSMSLNCAIELGIPDIIHKHGKPMTLPELTDALPINKRKSQHVYRLMRLLVHSKFFVENEEGYYWLTPASRLLLRDEPFSVAPLARLVCDPILMKPWHYMSEWLASENHYSSPFETAHGTTFFERAETEPSLNNLFNDAMARDARLVTRILVRDFKQVFCGIKSLVDVGGGTGLIAKAIADTFPYMKCIVLDLPHVVNGLEGTKNLSYVGGNMFENIPPADAVLLKWILHDWTDENCGKILKKCKEAIPKEGKVIIIEMVIEGDDDDKAIEDQLFFDMAMMNYLDGKERSEKQWEKLFIESGFATYKIIRGLGVRSLIELYP